MFKEPEIVAIERDGKDEPDRRVKTLIKWQKLYSMKATLKLLIETLLRIGKFDIVREICQLPSLKTGELG